MIAIGRLLLASADPLLAGCDSITVTQTLRNDADISSLAQVVSGNLRRPKEAPAQPSGLRARYLPIGVGRASPTLEDTPAEKPKKERKKKEKKEKDAEASERPSKKRKIAAPADAASESAEAKKSAKAEGSQEEKPKKSKKSKAEETPKKGKVKFADDEAPRSLTPIPPPSIPSIASSQVKEAKETPSKADGKKKRRLEGEAEPAEKKRKASSTEKKKKAAERPPPEGVKITPVAPPVVPGMQ